MSDQFEIKKAENKDVPLILSFIKELAEYEKLLHEVVATETILQETLFGEYSNAEVIIGYLNHKPNETAIGFYKRIGAQPMDEWTVYRVTGDALNNLAATWDENHAKE